MGNAEQLGVDAAVSWLGTQEWSNGNVGIGGGNHTTEVLLGKLQCSAMNI